MRAMPWPLVSNPYLVVMVGWLGAVEAAAAASMIRATVRVAHHKTRSNTSINSDGSPHNIFGDEAYHVFVSDVARPGISCPSVVRYLPIHKHAPPRPIRGPTRAVGKLIIFIGRLHFFWERTSTTTTGLSPRAAEPTCEAYRLPVFREFLYRPCYPGTIRSECRRKSEYSEGFFFW